MKYCKDCKHCLITDSGAFYARCSQDGEASLVTGKFESKCLPFCETQRHSDNPSKCGVEARFFEPKQPDENGVTHSGVRFLKGETYV